MKYQEDRESREALQDFCQEVDRIRKTEGIDWIYETCKKGVSLEEIKEVAVGVKAEEYFLDLTRQQAKDKVLKFDPIFRQEFDNKEIMRSLLISLMPPSIRKLREEIESLRSGKATGTKKSWAALAKESGINRQTLDSYINGNAYPVRGNLTKLAKIISPETVREISQELFGINPVEGDAKPQDLLAFTTDWEDEDLSTLALLVAKQMENCPQMAKLASTIMNLYVDRCVEIHMS